MTEPLRVLVVEDEALLLLQLAMTIEEEGHDVIGTAMTSGEAITLAGHLDPDIAFIDLQLLDGPTGLDVARSLRASHRTVVIFITANANRIPTDYEGAAGVVLKPFSQAGITEAIRFVEQCVRRPPPQLPVPRELKVSPSFMEAIGRQDVPIQ
jgi:DNA-binding response OmpR family regulator